MIRQIDINCDMGESYGAYSIGNDAAIMPLVSSSNIACGFHGGDPWVMEQTLLLAKQHKVRIGAHPGYPDLAGFGRRKIDMKSHELKAVIKYQVAAISGMASSLGMEVEYVKPHGALYNTCAADADECRVVAEAIAETNNRLGLMGLANSLMETVAKEFELDFIAEAFADRRYEPDGQLMSRAREGAVINDPEVACEQVMDMLIRGMVVTSDGSEYPLKPDSICIHGDNPGAVKILETLNAALVKNHIQKGK